MAAWQYYLAAPLDGKAPGWHPYSAAASAKLTALTLRTALASPSRTTFHVRSGHFHYEVNLDARTQRNTATGTVRPIRPPPAPERPAKRSKPSPGFALAHLFAGPAGHVWDALLAPVVEALPDAPTFVGPARHPAIFPPPQLTFQALLPLPPPDWRVVVIGQNPYPRLQSATGIAMFDAECTEWSSHAFGTASTLRNIVKAAAMAKHDIPVSANVNDLRAALRKHKVVAPPSWFHAMLAQGVLLLNAALTTGGEGLSTSKHAAFWFPVIEAIFDEILLAKSSLDDDDDRRGVTMLWWGGEALKVKKKLKNVFKKHEGAVPVTHLDWCNPAAHGDKFCSGPKHFEEVNKALRAQGQKDIDWLPDEEWLKREGPRSEVLGTFITDTQKLHSMYLERLQSGLEAVTPTIPVTGIMKQEPCDIVVACGPLGLATTAKSALQVVKEMNATGELTEDEKGAVYLYTGNSLYYRLNAALRSIDRSRVKSYFRYLQLFIRAHGKIPACPESVKLFRGIKKKLGSAYKEGSTITWWSVSSCSSNESVARGFAWGGTLFHVQAKTAVPIMQLSAYKSEEEYVLAPGTQLKVVKVVMKGTSLTEIFLEELAEERLVG